MSTVTFMAMYEDESVIVHFADSSRLQLSSCGAEFLFEKAHSPAAHPLNPREKIKQRTMFATSRYKTVVAHALEFRNKYATHPYVPKDLFHHDTTKSLITDVKWPSSHSFCTKLDPNGDVILCSLDGNARLVLSSSGEEFWMEFLCRTSGNKALHQTPDTVVSQHKSNLAIHSSVQSPGAITSRVRDSPKAEANLQRNQVNPKGNGVSPIDLPNTQSDCVYTKVVQHHSRSVSPHCWDYPLTLATKQWRSQMTNIGEVVEPAGMEDTTGEKRQSPLPKLQSDVTSQLPEPLPLKCPTPHQHRWRYASSTEPQEPEGELATELVRVAWCQGIIYRIIGGSAPVIEVSPGDGSVIRSNGPLAKYFTHHKAKPAHSQVVETTYFLNKLPPDIPGQLYSVSSAVTRASRILKCYNQNRDCLKLPLSYCCWKKREIPIPTESLRVVQEVHVPGSGHFLAFSDGSVEVIFLDGVKLLMTWGPAPITPSQCPGRQQPSRWCQLLFPGGHHQLVEVQAPGAYERYVCAALEWGEGLVQRTLHKDSVVLSETHHNDTLELPLRLSVAAELEKIKRFNFLLENHPALSRPVSSNQSTGFEAEVCDPGVSQIAVEEALKKTSRAIQDIDTLLSQRSARSQGTEPKDSVTEM